MLDEEVMTS